MPPQTASSGHDAGDTRFERRLRAAFAALPPAAADKPTWFWAEWKKAGGLPMAGLPDFQAAHRQAGSGLETLDRITLVLRKHRAEAKRAAGELREFIEALSMAAIERYLAESPAPESASPSGPVLVVRAVNSWTAALLAAVQTNTGFRAFAAGGSTARLPAQELREPPALALGEKAFNGWANELRAWAHRLDTPENLIDHAFNPVRAASAGPIDIQAVKLAIQRIDRTLHIRPIIVIHAGDTGELAQNETLRNQLRSELGVAFYVHELLSEPDTASHTAKTFYDEVLDALDDGSSATLARPASVFISYAHEDGDPWRQRIAGHLQSLGGNVPIDIWDDTRIQAGEDWLAKIEAALGQAQCAVLIVTMGFLKSQFIQRKEVPDMLVRRKAQGLTILPVIATPCAWETHPWLSPLQSPGGDTPLNERGDAERVMVELARRVHDIIHKKT